MLAETLPVALPVLISRWLHIAAVIVAVGGTVFLRMVLHPAANASLPADVHDTLRATLIRRWARFVHTAIGVILLSGIYNTIVMFPKHSGQPTYHMIWGVKILLALGLFTIAILLTSRSNAFASFRKQAPRWMTINILLAGLIVLLSNILKNLPVTTGG